LLEFIFATGLVEYGRQMLRNLSPKRFQLADPILKMALQPCQCVRHQAVDITDMVNLALDYGDNPNILERTTNGFVYVRVHGRLQQLSKVSLWARWFMEDGIQYSNRDANRRSSRTIDLLLQYGANPNGQYGETTTWVAFFSWLSSQRSRDWTVPEVRYYFDITNKLLCHGANVNARFMCNYHPGGAPHTTEETLYDIDSIFHAHLASKLQATVEANLRKKSSDQHFQKHRRRSSCCTNPLSWLYPSREQDLLRKPLLQNSH
jgi:hypothetical protein